MAMIQYLVDTNIISELSKKEPNSAVVDWASSIKKCALSVITVEELFYGLSWRPNRRIQEWVDAFIDDYTEVLPITSMIARRSGILRGQFQLKGVVRTQADLLIAATTLEHNLILVTHNIRDFDGCGIAVMDPFQL